MEMTTCHICGKIYGSTGDALCGGCRKLADVIYDKARTHIRDNPKTELNAKELAEAIKEDQRIIEILMLEGRFRGDGSDAAPLETPEERKRKKLLEDLQKNLASPSARDARAAAAKTVTTYGSDRHGRG